LDFSAVDIAQLALTAHECILCHVWRLWRELVALLESDMYSEH